MSAPTSWTARGDARHVVRAAGAVVDMGEADDTRRRGRGPRRPRAGSTRADAQAEQLGRPSRRCRGRPGSCPASMSRTAAVWPQPRRRDQQLEQVHRRRVGDDDLVRVARRPDGRACAPTRRGASHQSCVFHDVIRSRPHCCSTTSSTARRHRGRQRAQRVAVEVDQPLGHGRTARALRQGVVGVELVGAGAGGGEVHPRTLGLCQHGRRGGRGGGDAVVNRWPAPVRLDVRRRRRQHRRAARAGGPLRTAPRRAVLHRRRPPPAVGLSRPAAADAAARGGGRHSRPGSLLALRACRPSSSASSCCSPPTSRAPSAAAAARSCSPRSTTACGAGVLAIGHLLSTATLDLLAWTVVIRLVVATLQHDRSRLWLAVGLALGVGLENKHLVAFLAAGLVVGIATSHRCDTTCDRRGPGAVRRSRWRCGCPTCSGRPTTAGRSSSSPATSATSSGPSAAPSSSSPSRS